MFKPLPKKQNKAPVHNRNERLLIRASQDLGLLEVPGKGTNPKISAYYPYAREDNDPTKTMTDSVPFCSAAMCAWAEQVGMGSTNSLLARSWMNWGISTTRDPLPGDIGVLWRGKKSGWSGHVFIFVGWANEEKTIMYALGANQSDSVNVSRYSVNRLLGTRRSSKMKKLNKSEKDSLWAMGNSIIKGNKIESGNKVV